MLIRVQFQFIHYVSCIRWCPKPYQFYHMSSLVIIQVHRHRILRFNDRNRKGRLKCFKNTFILLGRDHIKLKYSDKWPLPLLYTSVLIAKINLWVHFHCCEHSSWGLKDFLCRFKKNLILYNEVSIGVELVIVFSIESHMTRTKQTWNISKWEENLTIVSRSERAIYNIRIYNICNKTYLKKSHKIHIQLPEESINWMTK